MNIDVTQAVMQNNIQIDTPFKEKGVLFLG